MAKRIFYHGTSADNLSSILENGISCNESKLWNCSNDEIYLWGVNEVAKAECCEDDDETANQYAFRFASESGQFACIPSKNCRLLVIKIKLDDTEILPDESHENMTGRGAVCMQRDILPSEIAEIKISNDLSLIKGYFISHAMNNELSGLELSRLEKKIGEAFQKAEIYPEDIEDIIEWQNVEIPQPA